MDKVKIEDGIEECKVLIDGLKGGLNAISTSATGMTKAEHYGLCMIGTQTLEAIEAELNKMADALVNGEEA